MSRLPPFLASRRGQKLLLLLGGGVLLAAAPWLWRRAPAPYTPGVEAAASDEITRTLDRTLPGGAPRVAFVDVAREVGIRFDHFQGRRSTQLPEDMGSGLAWGDYDGDGDPDLFIVNESGPLAEGTGEADASPAHARLFRNDGGRFVDVTDEAGLAVRGTGMGAAWGDVDGDGDLDLAVTRFGTPLLFENRGDGTFVDLSHVASMASFDGFWTGASWADADRDGDLDLYVCGYVRYHPEDAAAGATLQYDAQVPFTLNPSSFEPERNLYFRNDGGTLQEAAAAAGIDNPAGRSLSAAWADLDSDLWPDLYVANDISDNALFHNRGDGTFADVSHSAWVADYRGAMGLAVGDWENDGDLDIFVTHWIAQENALYVNQHRTIAAGADDPLHFTDEADLVGLGQIALDYVGWGTEMLDYDNDGRLDLFVVDGSTFQRGEDASRLVAMKNLLFWNGGREQGFFEVGATAGPSFAVENVARGAAASDYDGDGDLDLAIVENGGPARLLRNDGDGSNAWVRVVVRGPASPPGPGPATARFAEGARIEVDAGGLTQLRVVGTGPSYLSQSPPGEVTFGLGTAARVDALRVAWPDGSTQSFADLPVRSVLTIVEGADPSVGSGR